MSASNVTNHNEGFRETRWQSYNARITILKVTKMCCFYGILKGMKIFWTYFMHSLYSCSRAAHSLPPLALLFSSHWTLGHPDHKTKSVPKYLTMDLFRGMGSSACDQPKRAITKTKNLTIFRLFVCVFFIFGPQNILSCCFVKRRNSIENMRQKPTSK